MTSKDDARLAGRAPEFGAMSLKPGIGHGAMDDVASVLLELGADIPTGLRSSGSIKPLGRYLRKRLADLTGQEVKVEKRPEVLALFDRARVDKERPSAKLQLAAENEGKLASFKARSSIFKQMRKI